MVTVADTAFAIAVVRAEEGELPPGERLFEDPLASLFRPIEPDAVEATARFLGLPNMREAVRLRTRFIDDFVRRGLADGLAQIVILGAGFDARGMRMPEIREHHARVYEVDFPKQLDDKRAVLAAAGVTPPSWMAFVGSDFASDFEAALTAELQQHGFRTDAGTLFVWEGVIAYLDDAAIDQSLGFMRRAGGRGSRVAFDFSPLRFDPETAESRCRRAGFTAWEEVGCDELWRRHLTGEPHPSSSVVKMGTAFV